jgi:hypothetical protein
MKRKKTRLMGEVNNLLGRRPFRRLTTTIIDEDAPGRFEPTASNEDVGEGGSQALKLLPIMVPTRRELVLSRLLQHSLQRTGDNGHTNLKTGNDGWF